MSEDKRIARTVEEYESGRYNYLTAEVLETLEGEHRRKEYAESKLLLVAGSWIRAVSLLLFAILLIARVLAVGVPWIIIVSPLFPFAFIFLVLYGFVPVGKILRGFLRFSFGRSRQGSEEDVGR